jgi:hypothetical protein
VEECPRKAEVAEEAKRLPDIPARPRPTLPSLPFETDADDHCETSLQAYRDIRPFLVQLSMALKKQPRDLVIYDPYYCTGRVKDHLLELGFPNVHNEFVSVCLRNLISVDFDLVAAMNTTWTRVKRQLSSAHQSSFSCSDSLNGRIYFIC